MSESAPGVDARRLALAVLARVEDDDAFANLALSAALDESGFDSQDRGLVTDLVYGTLRRQRSCDFLADRFLTTAPPPAARRALRLGSYQLAFRADIPAYAAVDATVSAAPKRFRQFVNAVLRRVADSRPGDETYPDPGTRLSYPDWMIERLGADLGQDRRGRRPRGHERAAVGDDPVRRVRPGSGLAVGGRTGRRRTGRPGGRSVRRSGRKGHRDGPRRCGGDGGRPATTPGRSHRTTTSVASVWTEFSPWWPTPGGHRSAPARPTGSCSTHPVRGSGVLRRRADARWRLDVDAPDRLAALQRDLVDAAVPLVRPDGLLVYSVCTLTVAESTDIDRHLADHHPDLIPLDPPGEPWRAWGRGAILLPQAAGTDGMCMFRYRRR